jgi:hypothetical protein
VISPRDEIWIDMMQFDVRAADRLWEGRAPAQGAPGWYDDVSGLIETASGPAEPHELADEPVVVEDMHRTTLGTSRHCRRRRTVGRVIALKAAAATTASVFGVAAAAAATTGLVATMASVMVPVIEEHVFLAADEPELIAPLPGPVAGSRVTGLYGELLTLAQATRATPTPALRPPPDDAAPAAASVTPASPAPGPPAPVAADPVAVTAGAPPASEPAPATAIEPAPPAERPSAKPGHPVKSPPADTPPDMVTPSGDAPASPGVCQRGSGCGQKDKGWRKDARNRAPDEAAAEPAEHPPPHSRGAH